MDIMFKANTCGLKLGIGRKSYALAMGSGPIARALNCSVTQLSLRRHVVPAVRDLFATPYQIAKTLITPAPMRIEASLVSPVASNPVITKPQFWTETLCNGVKVIFDSHPDEKYASAKVSIIGASPLSEPEAKNGVAHVVEHMIVRPGKFELGRASTGLDCTDYTIFTTPENFNFQLSQLLNAIFHPYFDPAELEAEKLPISREMSDRYGYQYILMMALGNNRSSRPVIGNKESLTSITTDDLKSFHTKCYVGKNVVVTIKGRFNPAEARAALLDIIPPGENPVKFPLSEAPARAHIKITGSNFNPICILSRPVRNITPRDSLIMSVLIHILGRGDQSLLFKRIRKGLGQAYNVFCSLLTQSDQVEAIVINIHVEGKDVSTIKKTIDEALAIINLVAEGSISTALLSKCKEKTKSDYLLDNSTPLTISPPPQFTKNLGLSIEEAFHIIESIGIEEIQMMAKKLFGQGKTSLLANFNRATNGKDAFQLYLGATYPWGNNISFIASVTIFDFKRFDSRKDLIWDALIKNGYINSFGEIQPKFKPDQKSIKLGDPYSVEDENKAFEILMAAFPSVPKHVTVL